MLHKIARKSSLLIVMSFPLLSNAYKLLIEMSVLFKFEWLSFVIFLKSMSLTSLI
jgi:hypothetical protein